VTAPRPAVAAVASAVSICLLVVAACSGGSGKKLIPPPPNTVASITTSPPGSDYSGVVLPAVEGRAPLEKVEITGGDATLSGLVLGPDGPVSGATVRLERFVGDAVSHIDIVSNGDGTWRAPQSAPPTTLTTTPPLLLPGQLPTIPPATAAPATPPPTPPVGPQGILGGRYRVRAWRTPDLALTTPQILFLESKQNRQLSLQVARYGGVSASSISAPDPPILDGVVSVTAVVTSLSVSGDGIVSSSPLPGASVSLAVGSGWLFSGGPTFTNGAGRATFQLRCQALGQSPVELTVNNSQTFTLPVRACVAPPATTTTVFDPLGGATTSSILGGGASTTVKGSPTTT
jgi:hypothetical protein